MNRRSICGSCWISVGRVLSMLSSIRLMLWSLSLLKLFRAHLVRHRKSPARSGARDYSKHSAYFGFLRISSTTLFRNIRNCSFQKSSPICMRAPLSIFGNSAVNGAEY